MFRGDLDDLIDMLDLTLNSKRKKHIVGGMLLSISFLFGGLAITTMTISEDKDEKETKKEEQN